LENTTGHAAVEIIQTANNSSSVCLSPSNHKPAMTVPVLDSHGTSMVASLLMQSETTPDIVGCPAVVLVTGLSSIHATSLSQFKPPPDAGPGQPSLKLQPSTGLSLDGFARSPVIFKKTMAMTMHPYNRNVKRPASNKIITTRPTRKTALSHTQLLCLVAHGLDPVDVPLFIAGVEAIKMSNGQFPNFVPRFVREEINDLFGYPKKAPPPGPAPNMGNDMALEVPAPLQSAPTMGSEEVSAVVESKPLLNNAIPFGNKSCPLLAKTPVWAITHCLEWLTSVRKKYRLYPCTLKELGEAADDAFLIEGVFYIAVLP